jgi:hypothetical protein
MPADPEEAPSHTGVAGKNSSFPSPSSSTDVPAGLNTDTDALANQGPLPPRLPQNPHHALPVMNYSEGVFIYRHYNFHYQDCSTCLFTNFNERQHYQQMFNKRGVVL